MDALILLPFLLPFVTLSFVKINRSASLASKWRWAIGFILVPFLTAAIYSGLLQYAARFYLTAISEPSAGNYEMLMPYGYVFVFSLPVVVTIVQILALQHFQRRHAKPKDGK